MTATLVRPGVTHASAAVRKEAVKVCGLLGVVRGVAGDAGETVRAAPRALAAARPPCVAPRARSATSRCCTARTSWTRSWTPRRRMRLATKAMPAMPAMTATSLQTRRTPPSPSLLFAR